MFNDMQIVRISVDEKYSDLCLFLFVFFQLKINEVIIGFNEHCSLF